MNINEYHLSTKCVHGHSVLQNNQSTKTDISIANCRSEVKDRYARFGTYNSDNLEKQIANLYGNNIYASVFETGQLAWSSCLDWFIMTYDNVEVIIDTDGYSEILQALKFYEKIIKITYINIDNDSEIISAISNNHNTILFMFDSPTNPDLIIKDVKHITQLIKQYNQQVYILFDNTMATVMFQNPFKYNIDIVLESLTKYLAGHGDVLGGALYSRNQEMLRKIKMNASIRGSYLSSIACYLIQRGIATFALRMKYITKSAIYIRGILSKYTKHIRYVGYGGVILVSFGNEEINKKFLSNLTLFTYTTSFGHDDSIAEETWKPIKWGNNNADRHISIRLSIGIESTKDLVQDIQEAYQKTIT